MTQRMGWHREPARHALAARGVCTRFDQARIGRVGSGGVGLGFGRRGSYSRTLKRLAKGYASPPGEVDEGDYETAVSPLFLTLAEADELVDREELTHGRDRLTTALEMYGAMCDIFPAINDSDARDFHSAADAITQKLLAANRGDLRPAHPSIRAEAQDES